MKIISYNVNGIRSALNKNFNEWLKSEDPDIVCIQETKAQEDQIDSELFKSIDYNTYSFSAQKKGYSGVAILSKTVPDKIVKGIGIEKFDAEGRFIRADFGDLTVISVYFPSGSSGDQRQIIKMEWLDVFLEKIIELRKSREKLVINGDFNICRLWIDIHNPKVNVNTSGFLPEERDWFQKFIDLGFVDSFRQIDESPDNYSWWSYRAGARQRNKGWRIDYNIITENLKDNITNAGILKDVIHSDHCPVFVELK